ncbi:MAG: two-component regulator propeller domain-containing protein [Nibricoccus sp.]
MDKTGYLWVATSATLSRFDGSKFISFEPQPNDFRSPPGYGYIAVDSDNSLLLAPNAGGLLRLKDGIFINCPLPSRYSQRSVTCILRANDGALWIGFLGGAAIRQESSHEQIFELGPAANSTNKTQIVQDGTGRVWLTNGNQLARYENGALVKVPVRNEKEHLAIASARQDGPWIFSDERLFKVVGNIPMEIAKTNKYTSAHYIQAIWEDAAGELWLGTRFRGLRRVTPGGETMHIVENPGDISAVIEDTSSNVWAGTTGGGLLRIKPGVSRLLNKAATLVENFSPSICQDNQGTMWFANRDGGVVYLDEVGRVAFPESPKNWENFSILSVSPNASGNVFATSSHGLLAASRTQLQHKLDLEPGNIVRVSFTSRDGSLWLALSQGRLGRFKDGELTLFDSKHGLGSSQIGAIAEDPQGRLWLGCSNANVFKLENEHFTLVPFSTPNPVGAIQAIHFDASGTCWIGTERSGLLRLDENGFKTIDTKSGIPTNNITQIISDGENVMWLGSPDGIFNVQITDLHDYIKKEIQQIYPIIIGPDEGVSETTCIGLYQPSVWRSKDGLIWFATRQGVLAINPHRAKSSRTRLTVKINAVRVDDRSGGTSSIVQIKPGARSLELGYSVLCLSTPERVRTCYKLHGIDEDWTISSANNVVKYSRLPPGKYRFEVSALLAGTKDSRVSDTLVVVVQASWWQTLWFKVVIVSMCVAAIAFAIRTWSHKRLRARLAKLEHDSALEQERARIAKNIHDDLGAGLTRISLLTQSSRTADNSVQLDRIYDTVSELTASMDEIVWAVNPKNDDLENLANYLSDFAQNFLADAGIRCRVFLPDILPNLMVPAQHRHHVFMSCKEAFNNIAKHARASEVTLKLVAETDQLEIAIVDNGRGLNSDEKPESPPRVGSGNGLANMRSRMDAVGGSCLIFSPASGGTVVTFKIPLPRHPFI